MDHLLIIGLPIVATVAVLLAVRHYIRGLRAKGLAEIHRRHAPSDIVLLETLAQSFGEASRGAAQLRGSGALALTKTELSFLQYVTQRELHIPLASIESVSLVRSHLGKTQFTDLLHVRHQSNGQSDAIAWRLPDPAAWKDKLEALRR